MPKQKLYEEFMARMSGDLETGHYLESSWYAYAVLEDRLLSLLRNSGGEGKNGNSKPIKMMGPKLEELKLRAKRDSLLNANFEYDKLDSWRYDRNKLMHAMADASMTITQIDISVKVLAEDGAKLVREYAAACRRLKKHRAKVSS